MFGHFLFVRFRPTTSTNTAKFLVRNFITQHKPTTPKTARNNIVCARQLFTATKPTRNTITRFLHNFINGDAYTDFRKPKPTWKKILTEARFFIPFVLFPIGATVFYVSSLDEVQYTGRKRAVFVSRDIENILGDAVKQSVLEGKMGKPYAPDNKYAKEIARIGTEIAKANNLVDGWNWEFFLVENDDPNALCAPGGKVVVNTGLFSIVSNADELAVVLAHEIAHAVARHSAEKMSLTAVIAGMHYIIQTMFDFPQLSFVEDILFDVAVTLPHSRKMESEADFIGLHLMSHACFDPSVAPTVLRRLGGSTGSWLDSHPPPEKRATLIAELLPSVTALVDECSAVKHAFSAAAVDGGHLRKK